MMKVQSSTTTNNSMNFKGNYVLKGVAKDVNKASRMIYDKCGNETNKFLYPKRSFFEGFKECYTLNLQAIYSKNQPNVKKLIATNEHFQNIIKWNDKFIKPRNVRVFNIRSPYSGEPMNRADFEKGMRYIRKRIEEIERKMVPYKSAELANERGNFGPMADMLIDLHEAAKQRLQEVRDLAVVPMGEVAELDAKEVIAAIKQGRFDFINGIIK